ncbi:MAG: TfoX/Sxy family protein [Bacteroidia bacterium]
MASDPHTLERLRRAMQVRNRTWDEIKMFGGDCFMVQDKMCFGTYKGGIMFRVDPEETAVLRQRPHVEVMVQGGREMMGYLQASPEAYDSDADLDFWIDKCLEYNPKAPLPKSKKKK